MQAETRIYFTWEEVCELLTREAAKIAQFDPDGSKVEKQGRAQKEPWYVVVAHAVEPQQPRKPARTNKKKGA